MATIKHAYTDEELDAMDADDFFEALGIRDEVYQEAHEAHEAYVNGTREFFSWDDYIAKNGMK